MDVKTGALNESFPIAVVGFACRVPGAANTAEFWALLKDGIDAIGEVPPERWDIDAYYDPDPAKPGKMYTRAGGFIPDIDKFDAAFFGIAPREARRIDPQQRLLLELTWEALESGGIVPANIAGSKTGVFVGVSISDYAALEREEPEHVDAYVMSGGAISNVANRVSYIFDLHGPSFSVDTACSSSLVAVHEACVSLRRGDSTMAVAAGVNALLSPSGGVGFSKAHMLSPNGRCRPFDAAGDGYVRSEGCGVVILQPLAQALADGNPVYGVIVGSGVNSDGRTKGLAMPNQAAQEALLRQVYAEAGIDPRAVSYIEAHGTGTSVGDPIECAALGHVLGVARPAGDPCPIGSVKSNIGHLEPASGIAGLIKVLLALRHRALPRTLHFVKPNPEIPLDELNLAVVADYVELPPGRLTMGVNSFGFGGTNAHVIVQEPDPPASAPDCGKDAVEGVRPLLISAHSPAALAALASRYAEALRAPEAPPLTALCRTAATRRTHHRHRLAAFATSCEEMAQRLAGFAAGDGANLLVEGEAPAAPGRTAFLFSGNGAQWQGMGRGLLGDPFCAGWIGRVDAVLRPLTGWSVAAMLRMEEPEGLYDRTEIAQPALFAVQVAVLHWLREHGVVAAAVAGHSVGEVAAAYAAGILSLDQACRVVAERSRAQSLTAGTGRMAALGLAADEAAAAIAPYGERLTLAAVNSPRAVTVAGDADALSELGAQLAPSRVFFRQLDLDYAFHSRLMDPIRGMLLDRLDGLSPGEAQTRFVSTVTGDALDGSRLDAGYWWENIRRPVQFAAAMAALIADGCSTFIEIGPHPILDNYVRDCLKAAEREGASVSTLRRQQPERDSLWLALGRCYAAGAEIDYRGLFPQDGPVVALPAYPWQRERYWFKEDEDGSAKEKRHPLLGRRVAAADGIWKNRLDPAAIGWLGDHVVHGSVVLPGTGFIEMALAAVGAVSGSAAVEVEGFEIRRPVVIAAGAEPAIEADLAAEDGSFRLYAGIGLPPAAVARAVPLTNAAPPPFPLAEMRARFTGGRIDGRSLYGRFKLHGLAYGPAFQGIAEAWAGEGEALGRIAIPEAIAGEVDAYRIHPALLDACLQVTLATIPESVDAEGEIAFVPRKADRIRFYGGGHVAWCHVKVVRFGLRSIVGDYRILDDGGAQIAAIDGLRLSRVDFGGAGEIPAYHWRWQLRPSPDPAGDAADLPDPAALAPFFEAPDADAERDRSVRRALDRLAEAYASGGADEEWRRAVRDYPDHLAGLQLAARQAEATEPLSPPERDVLEHLHDSDPLFRRPNAAAAAMLRRLGSMLPETRFLRVIEIRGGTGGRAAALLPALPADRFEYVFTDPDEAAVAEAEVRFGGRPAVRCARLDPAADLAEQGFAGERFDLVVAEAAPQRQEHELLGIDRLLRPGGLLLLLTPQRGAFFDLALRHEPSRNAIGDCRGALAAAGFAAVAATGAADPLAAQAALIARKPGETADSAEQTRMELHSPRRPRESGGPGADDGALALDSRFRGNDESIRLEPSRATDEEPGAVWVAVVANPATVPDALRRRVGRLVLVQDGPAFERRGLDRFVVPAADRDGYARLWRTLAADGAARLHIVHLRSPEEAVDPLAAQRPGALDVLSLVQELAAAGLAASARLSVVTCGAMPTPGTGRIARPWQAAAWGLVRTVANERPDLACRLIDADPDAPDGATMAALAAELLHSDDEDEILLRGAARYAPRLMPGMPPPAPEDAAGAGFRLSFANRDASDAAILQRMPLPSPEADAVCVRVHATGLNFRDVLQRIGVLPEEAFEGGFAGATMGMEFAGEVAAVGAGVETLRPGDRVFGVGRDGFASHVVAPAFGLFKMPPSMSFQAAATLPVAAITVYYSLHHLARLQPGERILIQGAAGGVGVAAIQYAQRVGAEIFATAGSPEKRAFLRRLGIAHILDSRSLAFADEIREITGGEGVDVVLNSVAGEAIHKGIAILRPFGRFIELGKRDFYANSKLGLQPFRNNIQFFGVDVDQLLAGRPALAAQIMGELAPLIEEGVFAPLPYRAYPVTRAAEAFRCMQQSRHIGKIVVTMDAGDTVPASEPATARLKLAADAAYLVTGGRGGFGVATVEWLARRGAHHIAVVGRSEVTAPDAAAAFERLRRDGVAVYEHAADVADPAQVARLFRQMQAAMPPLRGIVHCAAVIQDAALANVTEDIFHDVLRPKVAGAWNLHRQTLDRELDFFVLYSSATTLFGNEGQASYVAANLYLEALAAHRRGLGLPATAVGWGAIADVGHLAHNPLVARVLRERLGVNLLDPTRALDRLDEAILSGASAVALADVSWSRVASLPGAGTAPKYSVVRRLVNEVAGEASAAGPTELRAHLAGLPRDEAVVLVEQLLTRHVAEVVGIAPSKLAADKSLLDLGMDSLMLVELQLGLEKQFGVIIPTLELFDMATLGKLARRIIDDVGAAPASSDPPAEEEPVCADEPAAPAQPDLVAALERALEDDLDRAKEGAL